MARKRPQHRASASAGKAARARPTPQADPFKWSTGHADWDGPWSWHHATADDIFKKIIPVLHHHETQNWGQILGDRDHDHAIPVASLSQEAQSRLQEVWNEDLPDKLFSLEVGAASRMWGIKQGQFLRILWWDPNHTVYPVPKHHT